MSDLLKRVPHWAIVRQAFLFSWRHKQLWFLGILAVFADIGGAFEVVLKALPLGDRPGTLLAWDGWLNQLVPLADLWHSAFGMANFGTPEGLISAFITAAVILAVTAVAVFVLTMAVASLVHAVGESEDGQVPTFAGSARHGLKRFWSVLAVIAVAHVLLSLALGNAALALQWVVGSGSVLAAVAFSLALAVFVAVAVSVSVIAVLALNEIVMNDRPVLEAGVWAWFHLRRHALAALELAAVILVVGTLVFLAALAVLLTCGVVILLLVALFAALKLTAAVTALKIITTVLIYVIAASAAGLVGVFQIAVWHLFWQRLAHRTFMQRVVAFAHRLLRKKQ